MARKGYCFKCNKEVTYTKYEEPTTTIVDGLRVHFNRILCKCNICGELVDDRFVEEENYYRIKDAFVHTTIKGGKKYENNRGK